MEALCFASNKYSWRIKIMKKAHTVILFLALCFSLCGCKTQSIAPVSPVTPSPYADAPVADEDITVSSPVPGMRPEMKEFFDSYEAFIDEYVEFMTQYMDADASDMLSFLPKYSDMLQKYADFTEKIDAMDETDMSDEELAYFLEVEARTAQKLLTVA